VKQSTFYLAQVLGQEGEGEADHELEWRRPEEIGLAWGHESHGWIVPRVLARLQS
jgi:hypothetical protein